MMHVRGLDHVSLRIRDLDRSRAFYEELVGLAPAPRPDLGFPGVWYQVGASQLHLLAAETHMEPIDPTGPHFAVEVPDVSEVRQGLEARGIPYLAFGSAQLWIRDPDGNVVEVIQSGAPR
jgi:glyoxylase I family protein